MVVGDAFIVTPDHGGRLECAPVLNQGLVSMAHDQASQVKCLDQMSVACGGWYFHLVVDGVLAEI